MKAYGRKRRKDIEFPDVADIQAYGLPSRAGRLPGKGGDIRPYTKSAKKKAVRRRQKRAARREGKREASEE